MQDDCDIAREVRNMYAHTNMLVQRFRKCSLKVKLAIFKAYFICFIIFYYGGVIMLVPCSNSNTVTTSVQRDSFVTTNMIVLLPFLWN